MLYFMGRFLMKRWFGLLIFLIIPSACSSTSGNNQAEGTTTAVQTGGTIAGNPSMDLRKISGTVNWPPIEVSDDNICDPAKDIAVALANTDGEVTTVAPNDDGSFELEARTTEIYSQLSLMQGDTTCAKLHNLPREGGLISYFGPGEDNMDLGQITTYNIGLMQNENNPEALFDSDDDGIIDSMEFDVDGDGKPETDYDGNGIYDFVSPTDLEPAACDILYTRPYAGASFMIHPETLSGQIVLYLSQIPDNIDPRKIDILDADGNTITRAIVDHDLERTPKHFALNLKTVPLLANTSYTLLVSEGLITCADGSTNPRHLNIPFTTFTVTE